MRLGGFFLLVAAHVMGALWQTEPPSPVSAAITPLNLTNFPSISTYLQVYDAGGNFIHGILPGQVSVIEDGNSLPVMELNEVRTGVQFALAYNPGRSFAIRDGQGTSRHSQIVQTLWFWAEARNDFIEDDLSLYVTGGPEATHLTNSMDWFTSLESYQADPRDAIPGYDSLVRAIETVAEFSPRPGMGRAILFVTPSPEGDVNIGLQSIAARARQLGIHIYVWMIASQEEFNSSGAIQLQELATLTGGQFFPFSGIEPIPDLESYLDQLRYAYQLVYESKVTESGFHEMMAQIQLGPEYTGTPLTVSTPPQSFEINIQPPNPMFVSPPSEVVRSAKEGEPGKEISLDPQSFPLEVLVDFPDGHVREIITMTLFVDDVPVAVEAPMTSPQIIWDLSNYTSSGEHRVWVEVVDSLGFRQSSLPSPVTIVVEQPPPQALRTLSRSRTGVVWAVVIISGAILLIAMIVSGKVRPRQLRRKPASYRANDEGNIDDMRGAGGRATEQGARPPSHFPKWINRLQWTHQRTLPEAFAQLVYLSEGDEDSSSTPIPVTSFTITFGKDPGRVTFVLNDASVDPLHARMQREGEGYRLLDENSLAGTWVNYTPIPKEGVILEHGDLLHIGQVGFRFLVHDPKQISKPVIRREALKL